MKNSIKMPASILLLLQVGMLLAWVTGCGSVPTLTTGGILDGNVQPTTLNQVKQSIDDLYTQHPDINSFVVQSVTYNPQTRDKVLKICSEGGLVDTPQELEAQKVLACAPLIFFFYYYGQQNSVPESIEVARQLYWYAIADKSDDSKNVLNNLLRNWGIK